MMTCKQYIFHITSGQAQEADAIERLWSVQHRLTCRRCRAFTRNDEQLSVLLQSYRDQVASPDKVVKE